MCADLVAKFNLEDPQTKPIVLPNAEMHRNTREISFHSQPLADDLYQTILPHLPLDVLGYAPTGVATRFRIFEHKPGCFFGAHEDHEILVGDSMSILTLLVYLSGDVEGGETVFEAGGFCAPATGRLLLFNHVAKHHGAMVKSGIKYTLRSDVLFRLREA